MLDVQVGQAFASFHRKLVPKSCPAAISISRMVMVKSLGLPSNLGLSDKDFWFRDTNRQRFQAQFGNRLQVFLLERNIPLVGSINFGGNGLDLGSNIHIPWIDRSKVPLEASTVSTTCCANSKALFPFWPTLQQAPHVFQLIRQIPWWLQFLRRYQTQTVNGNYGRNAELFHIFQMFFQIGQSLFTASGWGC